MEAPFDATPRWSHAWGLSVHIGGLTLLAGRVDACETARMVRPDPRPSPKPSKYWGFDSPFHGVQRLMGAVVPAFWISALIVVAFVALLILLDVLG